MQQNSNFITWLYPKCGVDDMSSWQSIPALEPFSEEAIEFLNSLSGILMKNPLVRTMPDVATFAFFCRRANILNFKKRYQNRRELRLGRGVVFHIAPSNVPVNFAYSLVCGVLSGNVNVVKVPSKEFDQVRIIAEAIEIVLGAPSEMAKSSFASRLALVKYQRGGSATDVLSALCDVRVIWGGDVSITTIRESKLPARAFDITFADRYSICVVDAERYINQANAEKVAEGFYNDTYMFDQNACSAPHLVVWCGQAEVVEHAKVKFWSALYGYTVSKYDLADVLAVDKLTAFYSQAVSMDIRKENSIDNLIWRVQIDKLPTNIDTYRCKAGYFTECRVDSLSEITHIINRKYQTLAYFGFSQDELQEFILTSRPSGVDRIVPIGKTTEFDLVWDSYDLLITLTREISIIA